MSILGPITANIQHTRQIFGTAKKLGEESFYCLHQIDIEIVCLIFFGKRIFSEVSGAGPFIFKNKWSNVNPDEYMGLAYSLMFVFVSRIILILQFVGND